MGKENSCHVCHVNELLKNDYLKPYKNVEGIFKLKDERRIYFELFNIC